MAAMAVAEARQEFSEIDAITARITDNDTRRFLLPPEDGGIAV
jgi:hypothetical protein